MKRTVFILLFASTLPVAARGATPGRAGPTDRTHAPSARAAALGRLGEAVARGDGSAVMKLVRALRRDLSPEVRAQAARALGRARGCGILKEVLADALHDSNARVRREAGLAARRVGCSLPNLPELPAPVEKETRTTGTPWRTGFLVRVPACVSRCDGTIPTFGWELGYRFFAFGLRYGIRDGAHFLYPDLRFFHDIPLTPRVIVTPFFGISPSYAHAEDLDIFELVLRPGLRLAYAVTPLSVIFVEPFALDIGVARAVSGGLLPDRGTTVRYSIGFGVQRRF